MLRARHRTEQRRVKSRDEIVATDSLRWTIVIMTKRRRRGITGAMLIVLYGVFIYAGGCADRLLLFPSTNKQDSAGAVRRLVPMGEHQVEVWVARSKALTDDAAPPAGYVIEFLGNASRAEWVAQETAWHWRDQPVEIWAVNYPGYGGSGGRASLRSFAPTSTAVYDHVRAMNASALIFVRAESIGTTTALYLATVRPVAGLVLSNPTPLRQLILGRFGWWNAWLVAGPVALGVPGELSSPSNAAKLSGTPVVFLSSLDDEVVPAKYQRKVIDAYTGPMQVIDRPNASHNSPLDANTRSALHEAIAGLWRGAVAQDSSDVQK